MPLKNEGYNRMVFRAVLPFGLMTVLLYQSVVSHFEINTGPMPTHSIIHYRCGAIDDTKYDVWYESRVPVCIDVLPQ